jgi:hypothetical protein
VKVRSGVEAKRSLELIKRLRSEKSMKVRSIIIVRGLQRSNAKLELHKPLQIASQSIYFSIESSMYIQNRTFSGQGPE